MKYINHLTITTGHVRRSYRDEVDDKYIAPVYALLSDAAASDKRLPMPIKGYQLSADALGTRQAVVSTIWSEAGQPLVTFGIATKRGDGLWRLLMETQRKIDPGVKCNKPNAPWCAVILLPALFTDLAATSWIGNFEAVAAWAWLEG